MNCLGVKPNIHTGYAFHPGMTNSSLRRGVAAAYMPHLGITGRRLIDYSGNRRHAVFEANCTWDFVRPFGHCIKATNVNNGGALSADGKGGELFTLRTYFTVAAWVAPDAATEGYIMAANATTIFTMLMTGGTDKWRVDAGWSTSGFIQNPAGPVMVTDEFHHVCYTHDATTGYLHMDGKLYHSAANVGYSGVTSAAKMRVNTGHWTGSSNRGRMAELIIWHRVLNAREILELYHLGKRY